MRTIELVLQEQLEDRTFEDFLEDFDLTPLEVFECLFNNGLIDEELLEDLYGIS